LENLDDDVDMEIGKLISANESLGNYELKQHKPWFDEECSRMLSERKQATLQRIQHGSQMYAIL
jgi:hypothetical protein